jgi:DNA-binding PadR family transcriptional regulator
VCARTAEALTTEHALLGLLREQPRHGYALYQVLTEPDGLWAIWRMKQSQLYALLSKLEDRGYLQATTEPQEGRPPRKVYALTQQGDAAFDQWLCEPVARGRQFRMDFMAKLYFARREGPAVVRALIERQRKACHAWVEHLTAGSGDQAEALFPRLVRSYRIGQIRAMLDWLNECEEEVLSDAS